MGNDFDNLALPGILFRVGVGYCPEGCFGEFHVDPARMRIRKPKTVTLTQLAVVTAVGIVGGIYIYKPLLEKFWFSEDSRKKADTTAQEASG